MERRGAGDGGGGGDGDFESIGSVVRRGLGNVQLHIELLRLFVSLMLFGYDRIGCMPTNTFNEKPGCCFSFRGRLFVSSAELRRAAKKLVILKMPIVRRPLSSERTQAFERSRVLEA